MATARKHSLVKIEKTLNLYNKILGGPKISFQFFRKMLWKNWNELFC